MISLRAIACVMFWNLFVPYASWSDECGKEKYHDLFNIGFALAKPTPSNPDAQQVAEDFVSNTLPRLLAEDSVIARQLGFTNAQDLEAIQSSGAVLETPFPLFVISLSDLRTFVKTQTLPLKLLAGDINWIRLSEQELVPARLLFPIRLQNAATKSSVLIEKGPLTPWRIHNAGAPALIRAVKLYSRHKREFIVWIPGINRHYLGRIGPDFRIKMTVLFDDPIARVNAGHEFDPCDSKVLDKLQDLDKVLQLKFKSMSAPVKP